MTAQEIFSELQHFIDEACHKKSFDVAIQGAESLGMTGGRDTKNAYTLSYEFKASDVTGATVVLKFAFIDQSRSFDIRSDLIKFDVTLTHPSAISESHKNEYER